MLTSIEKIGQVTDMNSEADSEIEYNDCYTNITLETDDLNFKFPDSTDTVLESINLKIEQGEKILLNGENGSGKSTLIRLLSGLIQPTSGSFFINDDTFNKIDLKQYRSHIGTIIQGETPFEGTVLENITFNNPAISKADLKWALDAVQLTSYIKTLPNGLETMIFSEGKQLSSSNAQKILLARSIINKPRLLFFEDPTDKMDEKAANEIIDFILSDENPWTVIVTSKNKSWKTKTTREITLKEGTIYKDIKK